MDIPEPEPVDPGSFDGDDINDAGKNAADADEAAAQADRAAQQDASTANEQAAKDAEAAQKKAAADLLAKNAQFASTTEMDPADAQEGAQEVLEFLDALDPDKPTSLADATKRLSPKGQKVLQAVTDTSQNVNSEMGKRAAKAGKTAEYNQASDRLQQAHMKYLQKWGADAQQGLDKPSADTIDARSDLKDAIKEMNDMNKSLTDPEKALAEGGMDGAAESDASKTAAKAVDKASWKDYIKYLGALGALVGLGLLLKALADDETGCYMVKLDAGGDSSNDKETMINQPDKNHKSCCICDNDYTFSKCPKDEKTKVSGGSDCVAKYLPVCQSSSNPACSGVVGSDGSVYYTWKTVTPLTILAGIPGAALKLAGEAGAIGAGIFGKFLMPIIIGICVLIVVITVCVIVVKVIHNKKKSK